MIINYFRVAIRNIIRQKGYSFINILGLTLGLATALFIFIWVYDESTYDRFHENVDNIYRVEMDQDYNGRIFHVSVTPYPAGEGWKLEVPEIEDAIRYAYTGKLLCKHGENRFYEAAIVPVDSTVFDVFTFPMDKGDPGTALVEPNSIVLTQKMAEKYFGSANPIGEVIVLDNQYNMTVTEVLKEIPRNSAFHFDFLVPFSFTEQLGLYNSSWTSNSIQTFVKLNPQANISQVNDKLVDVVKGHIDFSTRQFGPEDYTNKFMLAPLKKMHLHQYFGFNHTKSGLRSGLIMSIIGIFVLLIATINYMNLATARSARRAREIGLRKVSGGNRGQIIRQFFTESIVTSLISVILAVILVALLMDPFRLVSGKQVDVSVLTSAPFIISLLAMGILTGLLAGIYPALFLSGFKPVKVLYGDPTERGGRGLLRKVLVIVQFSISLLLIVGTTVVFLQNRYMASFDRGYDARNLIYVELFGDMNQSYDQIRTVFTALPEVEYVSGSMQTPGRIGSNSGGIDWDGKPEDLHPLVSLDLVDYDFVEMLGVPTIKGRSFSTDYPSDLYSDSTGSFMINKTLADIIGEEDVIGMNLEFLGISAPIIGVMDDYNFSSVQNEIPPLAISAGGSSQLRYIAMRVKEGDRQQTLEKLEREWNTVMPEFPLETKFVQDDIDSQNRTGKQMGKLLLSFTIIAILIACLGLLGLSAFMAEKRTREFGIRKTMGASMMQIISLMIRQFSWLVIISMIIALPVGYYLLNGFLQDFANRISLSWYVFAIPAVGVYIVAILTVSTHAIKASLTDPSICLHYE